MHDRLDGCISFLIRCPGFDVQPDIMADKIPMDVYITPHEVI